jgi:ribosomal protein L29
MAKKVEKAVVAAEQTKEQLQAALTTKQADLLGYMKGLAGGELKNTAIIRTTRRDIARIKTALAGKEGEK